MKSSVFVLLYNNSSQYVFAGVFTTFEQAINARDWIINKYGVLDSRFVIRERTLDAINGRFLFNEFFYENEDEEGCIVDFTDFDI